MLSCCHGNTIYTSLQLHIPPLPATARAGVSITLFLHLCCGPQGLELLCNCQHHARGLGVHRRAPPF